MMGENAQLAVTTTRDAITEATSGNFDGRAVLLFSGGRDSSAVAAAFCHAFPDSQLHLLLVDNGLLSRLDSTKRQANLIRNLFPRTDVIFEARRVSEMMRRVGMQSIERDFTERGYSTMLICLACKLIMNVSAARYAHELGIGIVLDGYANRQQQYPEQTDEFMSIIRRFYSESGVTYLSPLYDFLVDKGLVNQTLGELGVYIPKQEPVCMWADAFSTAKPDEIERYAEEKLAMIRQLDPVLHA